MGFLDKVKDAGKKAKETSKKAIMGALVMQASGCGIVKSGKYKDLKIIMHSDNKDDYNKLVFFNNTTEEGRCIIKDDLKTFEFTSLYLDDEFKYVPDVEFELFYNDGETSVVKMVTESNNWQTQAFNLLIALDKYTPEISEETKANMLKLSDYMVEEQKRKKAEAERRLQEAKRR